MFAFHTWARISISGSALSVVVNAQADAQGQESFAGFGVATQPAVGSRRKPEISTGHHNPITPQDRDTAVPGNACSFGGGSCSHF